MSYLKSLFFNFLTVFFANHILPGIEVVSQTKLPHLGGDLPFAMFLGLLNSLIYPVLRLMDQRSNVLRIGMIALVMNFSAYALLKILPIGIHVSSVEGYLLASLIVSGASFLTNFLEMQSSHHRVKREAHTETHPKETHKHEGPHETP